MKRLGFAAVIACLLMTFTLPANAQKDKFNTGKNLEIQYNILRALNAQYVDTISVDTLVLKGMNAMLASLDPYTMFFSEDHGDDLDMMTTNTYGGVGAQIKKLETGEIEITQPYAGSPAEKFNLIPGDRILTIDGKSTKDMTVSEASKLMRGKAGTLLKMDVKKLRSGELEHVKLIRERVHVSDVMYSGIIRDSIGYIRYTTFTQGGADEFREALSGLQAKNDLKGLVIDLRGNGGGLMSEAIDLLSTFLPSGTVVVSSKGKDPSMNKSYKTTKDPIAPTLPLLVLVDNGTASSSEIVTGALQDLDRATVAGLATFGKGLIQSIRPVGYNTSIKLTTGRYYTPSGRCVQAIDYSHRNADGSVGHIPDSLRHEFHTASGRVVKDGGGITPDFIVKPDYYTRPLASLVYNDIPNEYAIKYFSEHDSIPAVADFSLSDEEYEDFVNFAKDKKFDQSSEAYIGLKEIIKVAKKEGTYKNNAAMMDSLLTKLACDKEVFLRNEKKAIVEILERSICNKYYFVQGGAEKSLKYDEQLHRALDKWNPSTPVSELK